MTVTINAGASVTGNQSSTAADGGTIKHSISHSDTTEYTDGTTANKADLVWSAKGRSLAATTENIDLAGGLTDEFGNTITFAEITAIYIHNKNTTAGETLTIGGAGANTFLLFADATDKFVIDPDGKFFFDSPSAAAKAVTAGTGDILLIDAGAATITYDIVIVGRSA